MVLDSEKSIYFSVIFWVKASSNIMILSGLRSLWEIPACEQLAIAFINYSYKLDIYLIENYY